MDAIERILRRDRRIVCAALAAIILAAWIYTLAGAGMGMSAFEMTRHSLTGMDAAMPDTMRAAWTPAYAVLILAMWWIMMIAMMLPSAAPTILLASALNRRSNTLEPPFGTAGYFTAGYLLAWLFFSALAVGLQWALAEANLVSTLLQINSHALAGVLLCAAGLWQFTPVKQACLRHCRSPVRFLTERRRKGNGGAIVMGAEHGAYCLGCCWFLMALLFVGGIMNLYWIAGLAVYVLAEKLLPAGAWIGRAAGAGLVIWGVIVLVR